MPGCSCICMDVAVYAYGSCICLEVALFEEFIVCCRSAAGLDAQQDAD